MESDVIGEGERGRMAAEVAKKWEEERRKRERNADEERERCERREEQRRRSRREEEEEKRKEERRKEEAEAEKKKEKEKARKRKGEEEEQSKQEREWRASRSGWEAEMRDIRRRVRRDIAEADDVFRGASGGASFREGTEEYVARADNRKRIVENSTLEMRDARLAWRKRRDVQRKRERKEQGRVEDSDEDSTGSSATSSSSQKRIHLDRGEEDYSEGEERQMDMMTNKIRELLSQTHRPRSWYMDQILNLKAQGRLKDHWKIAPDFLNEEAWERRHDKPRLFKRK